MFSVKRRFFPFEKNMKRYPITVTVVTGIYLAATFYVVDRFVGGALSRTLGLNQLAPNVVYWGALLLSAIPLRMVGTIDRRAFSGAFVCSMVIFVVPDFYATVVEEVPSAAGFYQDVVTASWWAGAAVVALAVATDWVDRRDEARIHLG